MAPFSISKLAGKYTMSTTISLNKCRLRVFKMHIRQQHLYNLFNSSVTIIPQFDTMLYLTHDVHVTHSKQCKMAK